MLPTFPTTRPGCKYLLMYCFTSQMNSKTVRELCVISGLQIIRQPVKYFVGNSLSSCKNLYGNFILSQHLQQMSYTYYIGTQKVYLPTEMLHIELNAWSSILLFLT